MAVTAVDELVRDPGLVGVVSGPRTKVSTSEDEGVTDDHSGIVRGVLMDSSEP